MKTIRFKTNLRCGACEAAIKPLFDAEPRIHHWSADVASPEKSVSVTGDEVDRTLVEALLAQKGYKVLDEYPSDLAKQSSVTLPEEPKQSYFPLVLILGYLVAIVGLIEIVSRPFDTMRAMGHFMAGFFLVFSFFKMLNLSSFAMAYSSYDVVARRWYAYGYFYPFVELLLGMAYLAGFQPTATNAVTLVVMGISAIGVVQSLLARRKIRCACLGTVFNLPMSVVTLVEDLLMVGMAGAMLLGLGGH